MKNLSIQRLKEQKIKLNSFIEISQLRAEKHMYDGNPRKAERYFDDINDYKCRITAIDNEISQREMLEFKSELLDRRGRNEMWSTPTGVKVLIDFFDGERWQSGGSKNIEIDQSQYSSKQHFINACWAKL